MRELVEITKGFWCSPDDIQSIQIVSSDMTIKFHTNIPDLLIFGRTVEDAQEAVSRVNEWRGSEFDRLPSIPDSIRSEIHAQTLLGTKKPEENQVEKSE